MKLLLKLIYFFILSVPCCMMILVIIDIKSAGSTFCGWLSWFIKTALRICAGLFSAHVCIVMEQKNIQN